MISIYGLNDKIGNISYYDSTGANEYGFTKPYSEQTAQTIDQEVSKLIEASYTRAKDILTKNKHLLTLLAEKLLEKEVIFKEDLETIFGKRPFDKEELPLLAQDEKNPANSTLPPAENKNTEEKSQTSENGRSTTPQDTLF
jgi:hypothetical protein